MALESCSRAVVVGRVKKNDWKIIYPAPYCSRDWQKRYSRDILWELWNHLSNRDKKDIDVNDSTHETKN